MSLAARYVADAAAQHMQDTMAAHRAWAAEQEQIAQQYEQLIIQAAAWRVQAMADADSRYRAAHGTATSQLVSQLPKPIQLALEAPPQQVQPAQPWHQPVTDQPAPIEGE